MDNSLLPIAGFLINKQSVEFCEQFWKSFLFQFALPNSQYRPTTLFKGVCYRFVPRHISSAMLPSNLRSVLDAYCGSHARAKSTRRRTQRFAFSETQNRDVP
jgi:hypothetical protein